MGLKAASLSEAQLMLDAKFLKHALLGKIRSGGAGEHATELYQLTLAEASEKSWLCGPFSPSDFDKQYNGDHPSRGSLKELEFLQPYRCIEPLRPLTKFKLRSNLS